MNFSDRVFYAVLLLIFLLGTAYAFGKEGGLVATNPKGAAAYEKERDALAAREAKGEAVPAFEKVTLLARWVREVPSWKTIGILVAVFLRGGQAIFRRDLLWSHPLFR